MALKERGGGVRGQSEGRDAGGVFGRARVTDSSLDCGERCRRAEVTRVARRAAGTDEDGDTPSWRSVAGVPGAQLKREQECGGPGGGGDVWPRAQWRKPHPGAGRQALVTAGVTTRQTETLRRAECLRGDGETSRGSQRDRFPEPLGTG